MMRTRKKIKGFTMVETLIAISILSLSILSTFTAVQQGLQSSGFAKDQITAFYLVQEVMEYMRNTRDTNHLASIASVSSGGSQVNWLTGIAAQGSDPCYFGKICTLDSPLATLATIGGGQGTSNYLRQDSSTGLFGYTGSWTQTKFRREITLTQINSHEVSVSVYIAWTSGVFSRTFQVSQLLFDTN